MCLLHGSSPLIITIYTTLSQFLFIEYTIFQLCVDSFILHTETNTSIFTVHNPISVIGSCETLREMEL